MSRESELYLEVDPTWADQGGVKLLRVVGGHDEYATFVRGSPIDDIEQVRKSNLACGACAGSSVWRRRLARDLGVTVVRTAFSVGGNSTRIITLSAVCLSFASEGGESMSLRSTIHRLGR